MLSLLFKHFALRSHCMKFSVSFKNLTEEERKVKKKMKKKPNVQIMVGKES